ncbi:hypothetical protein BD780_000545 [Clostridium tetanomorphum]|uniref:DUF4430 domain-containing protein n=1 Tax=Clostridium tetanomorphum TaxID=1553 RepID=UPI000D9B87DD|nr:DUF4430 domain-containing protein [Clostridium tetanomorphum]MBP1865082.1 hypothetical protein [Clostridium tetanomorphum]NRS83320.1 hypothetical protein [Clostridium tetanomorphum]SQC01377.1 surface/cell-adhesion protein [Clostridium tetanomorphum]
MSRKKRVKRFLSIFLTFLMVSSTVHTGIFGMRQVYAEKLNENNTISKNGTMSKENIVSIDKDKKETVSENIIKDDNKKVENKEIKKNPVRDTVNNEILEDKLKNIINELEKSNSIKIVNDFTKVKVGDSVDVKVQDQNDHAVPVENLTFTISNKELGRMDKKIPNKFIALGSGTIVIKAALKDKPNISNEAEFKIQENLTNVPVTKVNEVEDKPAEEKVKVKLRVEGSEYTILPETEIEVKKGATNKEALEAAGLVVEESSGMIGSIEGVKGDFFWSINPYGTNVTEGSSIVFNGNGAMGTTIVEGPSTANAEEVFEVTYKESDGTAIKDGEIKYYKASEYDYKSINKGKIKPVATGVKTDENGKASIKLKAGKYFITAEGEEKSRAKAFEIEVKATSEANLIKAKLRVEGKEYTILPETEVSVKKGATNKEALEAAGLVVEESSGMIGSIEGVKGDFFWSINPYGTNVTEGSSIVFNGNGAMGTTIVEGPSTANAEEVFEVTYKESDGTAIKDGEIKYYKASEYDYKSINKGKIKPVATGVKTDENGKASIKLEAGKYFITAEGEEKSRAKAFEIEVKGTTQKLKATLKEKIIYGYPFQITVVDELGKAIENVNVSCHMNKDCLINDPNKYITGKTDKNGKVTINDIVYDNTSSKVYFILEKEGLKSDIQECEIIKGKYKIIINPQRELINEGDKIKFNVSVKDNENKDINNLKINWESEDNTIATVDQEGNVKGIKVGKTFIKVTLADDPKYYAKQSIEVTNNIIKTHLRVEIEEGTDFCDDIEISETETRLENILKGKKGKKSYKIYEPKFNDEGKLIQLSQWLGLKGEPYFSVKINGKVIDNPKAAMIKIGDSIICSYNGATKQLKLEAPKEVISDERLQVIVKDEDGKVIEGANVFIKYFQGWLGAIQGNTDANGIASFKLNLKGDYSIFVEKDGYIRSVAEPIKVVLPKIEINHPKEVNNNEDFNITLTANGKPAPEVKIYWEFYYEDKVGYLDNNKLMGKTDEYGKTTGKIDAPKGQYTLIANFHENSVKLGEIIVLDKHKYQSSIIATMDEECKASAVVNLEDKIYLFGGKSIKIFDTKTNKINHLGDLSEDFKGEAAKVKNKIYLFGNEKVYEYDVKNNKVKQIANLPEGYKIVGRGTAVINNKVYIYERKQKLGAIVEFDVDTKTADVVYNIDINRWVEYRDEGQLDEAQIIEVNEKVYIIGGYDSLNKIYEFNPINKQMSEVEGFDHTFQSNSPVNINGKIYIIDYYHILEIDLRNKTINSIGYAPKKILNDSSILINDTVYTFEKNWKNETEGDIIKITGFSLKDTQKPEITISGIKDNIVVSTKEVAFTVSVTDNVDKGIIPEVRCNDKVVSEKDGKYNIVLQEGKNTIEITAKDKAGNVERKEYTLIYSSNIVVNKIVIEGSKERLHPKDKITLKGKAVDEQNNVIPGREFIFSSSDEKIAKVDSKTGEVTAIGNGTVILTVALKDDGKIKESVKVTVTDKYEVYMRIEAYDHTVLPRTKLEVGLFDLNKHLGKASGSSAGESSGWGTDKFDKPSNAHAIVQALLNAGFRQKKSGDKDGPKLFDFQDYGWSLYIAMIDGDREFKHGGPSGWLYRVNDTLPNVGCADTSLNDGDEIVWMYSPYGFDNIYTKIFADETDVSVDEEVQIKLSGYTGGYEKVYETVGKATILVNDKPYKINGQEVVTGAKGNATLTFDKPGDYTISAIRLDGRGLIDIIRPNPIVIHVRDKKDDKKPEISVKGIINGETVNKSEITFIVKAEDPQDGKLIPIVKCNDEILEGKDDNYKAVLKEGKNIIKIIVEDKDKNIVEKTIQIICDTEDKTLPEIKADGITSGTTDKQELVFSVEANDKKDGKLTPVVKVNGKEILPQEGKYKVLLKDGLNVVTIEAVNKLGNKASDTYNVTYKANTTDPEVPEVPETDKEAPKIEVTGITNGQEVSNEEASFKVTVTDNVDSDIKAVVKLNGEVITGTNGDYKVKLKGGENTITVEAKDLAGNKSDITYKITYKKGELTLEDKVNEAIEKVHNYIIKNSTYSSDWKTVAFNKSGLKLPENYNSNYLNNVAKLLQESKGHFDKVTDYERITLGVVAAGGDPRNIGGYNLLDKIYNFNDPENPERELNFQGLNGVIYGLIALDSKRYKIPAKAKYTREYMLDYILDHRNSDGGWDLNMNGKNSDVDITSMTLISLAPYHDYVSKRGKSVRDAVNEASNWLSKVQRRDGGFNSWFTENNSESCSQTIIGLSVHGVDPTSAKFTKDRNLVENLLKFQQPSGEFYHLMDGSDGINGMSTEQAYQALLAYRDFVRSGRIYNKGKNSIYYFGESDNENPGDDTNPDEGKDTEAPKIVTDLTDGKEVATKELSFKVEVTDNVDNDIVPIVKLNGEFITGIDGEYKVELKDGENIIEIEAVDEAGNKVNESYKIIKTEEKEDTEVPKIEVIGLTDDVKVTSPELSFKVKVTDNVDEDIVVVVKFNGEIITGNNGDYKVKLKDGDNTIEIEAVDKAGNKSSDSYGIRYKVIEMKPAEEIKLQKGVPSNIKVNVENISEEVKEVTLTLVLYDKATNEMKGLRNIKKEIKSGENDKFDEIVNIPQEGDYFVKIILCDDLSPEKMNILADPVLVEVK